MVTNKKIVVGVSGGVDSSVTLALLKEQGYQPVAVSLLIPVYDGNKKKFVNPVSKNIVIAKNICKKLNVVHQVYDLSKDFEKTVVDYFLKEYKKGRVPNPCVFCNRYFKFKGLFDFAKKKNISLVATGHYAKTKNNKLLIAKDETKDQTYGLCFLKKSWLKKIVFPLGELTKKEVYLLAEKHGFFVFKKEKQSQDICFLKGCSVNDLLKDFLGINEGKIIDANNNILGRHNGLYFYTTGQRKGLGFSKKYFVLDKQKNNLVVTTNEKDLYKKQFFVKNYNLLINNLENKTYHVKTRYSQKPVKANIKKILKTKQLEIRLLSPQKAITPGQVCTIYDKDVCVGGGFIV